MKKMLLDESGQGMVEYGLILGLIAVAAITAIIAFKDDILGIFTRSGTQLDNAGIPD